MHLHVLPLCWTKPFFDGCVWNITSKLRNVGVRLSQPFQNSPTAHRLLNPPVNHWIEVLSHLLRHYYRFHLVESWRACENIRFSSLFATGEVSRRGTSATKRQKFHTGVWVGYGGVKTLENRSRKFNLLLFSRLPWYVYMDDILSRFKGKEWGSSSSDSETSPQGKKV